MLSVLPVAASVLVGGTTHLVWDSFTHSGGLAVQSLPALSTPVHLFDWYTPRVYTVLQHGSTLGGLGLLAVWGVHWFRGTSPMNCPETTPLPRWLRLLALCAILLPSLGAGLRVLWLHLGNGQPLFPALQNYLGRAIFSAGTAFLAMLVLTALAWRAWESSSRHRRGCPTRA